MTRPLLNGEPIGSLVGGFWAIHNLRMKPGDTLTLSRGAPVYFTGLTVLAGKVEHYTQDGDETHAGPPVVDAKVIWRDVCARPAPKAMTDWIAAARRLP